MVKCENFPFVIIKKTKISINTTSVQLHIGGLSQCTKSRKNEKYRYCDNKNVFFSTDDMIEYVGS